MSTLLITRPLGRNALPYVVAEVRRAGMRITHVVDLIEAKRVQHEWECGEYSFNKGAVRSFFPALSHHEPA